VVVPSRTRVIAEFEEREEAASARDHWAARTITHPRVCIMHESAMTQMMALKVRPLESDAR